jgi:7-keto-8-aminopelargonate synthetase-like enzyme
VYSTALTPGVLAGVEAVLDIMATDFPAISQRMWDYKTRINRSLQIAGFPVVAGEAPIIGSCKLKNSYCTFSSVAVRCLHKETYNAPKRKT